MYDEKTNVAVIGDRNMVFPFRALGIKAFSPHNLDEAREILESLEKEKVALCFLHQTGASGAWACWARP